VQDGVMSANTWISDLKLPEGWDWDFGRQFDRQAPAVWSVNGTPMGWKRSYDTLTQVSNVFKCTKFSFPIMIHLLSFGSGPLEHGVVGFTW
jgi:hypothetical protein